MRPLPHDTIPLRERRAMFGWFGEPWWSFVCYGDDGKLITDMRKGFPHGQLCLECEEEFADGDSGQAMPHVEDSGRFSIRHVHKECSLRAVLGGAAHLEGKCSCYPGGTDILPTGVTRRQDALAVWAIVQERSSLRPPRELP